MRITFGILDAVSLDYRGHEFNGGVFSERHAKRFNCTACDDWECWFVSHSDAPGEAGRAIGSAEPVGFAACFARIFSTFVQMRASSSSPALFISKPEARHKAARVTITPPTS
jgi:hypothetical protein